MARRKTRQHSAPDMPVRFFQLPEEQPVAVLSLADFLELFVLARAANDMGRADVRWRPGESSAKSSDTGEQ